MPFLFITYLLNIYSNPSVLLFRPRHEELLNMSGIYAEMWNQQSQQQSKSQDTSSNGENQEEDIKEETVKNKGVGKNSKKNAI